MSRITKLILITLITLSTTLTMSAQKYGHLNLGNLLTELPESDAMNKAIITFRDNLVKKGEKMSTDLQSEAGKFQEAYQNGTKSQIELQSWQERLQKKEAELQQFSYQSEQDILIKRNELLAPILAKIETAIKAVAKENGYLMIFDVSTGSMMYVNDTDDVQALVKAKL